MQDSTRGNHAIFKVIKNLKYQIDKYLYFIFSFFACLQLAKAVTDDKSHVSPNGKFLIRNIGNTAEWEHYFELQKPDGSVVFSFRSLPFYSSFPSFAEDIKWSGNGRFVAVTIGTGKYTRETLVISTSSGRMIHITSPDSDFQTRPVRWTTRGELVVETRAPFGGKLYDDEPTSRYRYRRTFRIRNGGRDAECVYKGRIVNH